MTSSRNWRSPDRNNLLSEPTTTELSSLEKAARVLLDLCDQSVTESSATCVACESCRHMMVAVRVYLSDIASCARAAIACSEVRLQHADDAMCVEVQQYDDRLREWLSRTEDLRTRLRASEAANSSLKRINEQMFWQLTKLRRQVERLNIRSSSGDSDHTSRRVRLRFDRLWRKGRMRKRPPAANATGTAVPVASLLAARAEAPIWPGARKLVEACSNPLRPATAIGVPSVVFVVCGMSASDIRVEVERVGRALEHNATFYPIFLTDSLEFGTFFERSLAYEYIPPKPIVLRGSSVDWDSEVRRRARAIARRWRPSAALALGKSTASLLVHLVWPSPSSADA